MNEFKAAPNLGVLLVGALTLWATACFLMHGPVILTYVGLQVITSGVFAAQMFRIEKSVPQRATKDAAASAKVRRAA
ncbi:MAG: hypothetical protein ACYTGL_11585 [Planctomycetota bacterium]|jgi:hypothetical protein